MKTESYDADPTAKMANYSSNSGVVHNVFISTGLKPLSSHVSNNDIGPQAQAHIC